jgi:hypothetical protein
MNTQLNNTFNAARKVLGEDAVIEIIKSVDAQLQDTIIKGRGNSRAQLGLSSKNVRKVMKIARYVKVSTGIGAHNYKIMFPAEFAEMLKHAIFTAAISHNNEVKSPESAELVTMKA